MTDVQLIQQTLTDPVPNSLPLLLAANLAPNTQRAYVVGWNHFKRLMPDVTLPCSTDEVLRYIDLCVDLGLTVSTIQSRLGAVKLAHSLLDLDFPQHPDPRRDRIRLKIAAVKRQQSGRARRTADPITQATLAQMVTSRPDSLLGLRDRVTLLVGFTGALRRSELAAIDIPHLRFQEEGLVIWLPASKSDQYGEGTSIYIGMGRHFGTCPVRQTQRWLNHAARDSGPLLVGMRRGDHLGAKRITGGSIDTIVKRSAAEVGAVGQYSAHSLRAGLATAAARSGMRTDLIMKQTRHASLQTLMGYIRAGTGFGEENVMNYLGML